MTPADRIFYGNRYFEMKDVKEIGRRRGLKIRAVAGGGGRVMKARKPERNLDGDALKATPKSCHLRSGARDGGCSVRKT